MFTEYRSMDTDQLNMMADDGDDIASYLAGLWLLLDHGKDGVRDAWYLWSQSNAVSGYSHRACQMYKQAVEEVNTDTWSSIPWMAASPHPFAALLPILCQPTIEAMCDRLPKEEALFWVEEAHRLGNRDATYFLAYTSLHKPELLGTLRSQMRYLEAAAKAGFADMQRFLGSSLYSYVSRETPDQITENPMFHDALDWLHESALQNDASGMNQLGMLLVEYSEKLNPKNPNQTLARGAAWIAMAGKADSVSNYMFNMRHQSKLDTVDSHQVNAITQQLEAILPSL
ncbi:hypothetical protein AB6D11_00095 [Vibrio splendidus]